MKYCSTCLQPDTRPNTKFTNDQLCPACNYYKEESAKADWNERFEILQDLLIKFKKEKKKGQFFDCIIGVSGGKDSTRQALWVRDKLGLNPLLVCLTYPPEQLTERGVNNLSNLIELGFDVIVSALAPETWRKMLKQGFYQFTNWAKSSEMAILSAVPQIAIKYNIKYIFWGENPGLQLGDMSTIGKTGYDGNNLKYMNTVQGGDLEWLTEAGFKKETLMPYSYPSSTEFDNAGIQIIYLGWFWRDWSIINNGVYSSLEGLEIREDTVENTGDLLGIFSLDEDWVTLNQMIKYYKYGFGRVTDYCNEEIRLGNLSRDEGIILANEYDDACSDEYINSFCEYIRISPKQFWSKVRSSVNRDLFHVHKNGDIVKKFTVGRGL